MNVGPINSIISDLEARAKEMRREMVRMVQIAGSGHLAPALSCADIVTALYFKVLKINPRDPKDEDRDRFLLSAGHKCLALYVALAMTGYFQMEALNTFLQFGSMLGGHPDSSKIPGVEISTGALGHGLPIGVGMGLGGKLLKKDYKIYVLLGDGEISEGSNWEAASAASHFKLDNLIGIIDRNGLCADGYISEVMNVEPLVDKWSDFGWETREIDGHNMEQIVSVLENMPVKNDKPTMIIANTIKGKGVSFMENRYEWHNKVPTLEQFEIAFRELA
ncbi:MAG: transketolase [Actinobacteria bacterium]|nr:transketolase [Actinomycetota bacterium]